MTSYKDWVLPIVLLLLATFPGIGSAQEEVVTVPSGIRPDAPTYGVRGQYPVGTHNFRLDDEAALDITIWYPALPEDNAQADISYAYETNPDASMGMEPTVAGYAFSEAAYDLTAEPYPLVIISHGYSLGRTGYAWLAEHIASHGFVVVAPQHYEVVDETLSEFWSAAITRPQEIVRVLDYLEAQTLPDGNFAGLIDTERIAVIGHSYGGYTALAMAGARLDIDGMQNLCTTAQEASDPNAWLCGLVLPYVNDMAELAGFDAIPDGLWPSWGDSRVDVVVSMAGDAYFFNEAGLSAITIPVMSIGGTGDTGTPYLWGTYPTYEYVASTTKARVALENAEHMIFGATCEDLPWFTEIGFYAYCSDPVWDMDRAHDLINHFTTAFLLAELNQDQNAATTLAPDAVSFPGVTYDAQGY